MGDWKDTLCTVSDAGWIVDSRSPRGRELDTWDDITANVAVE